MVKAFRFAAVGAASGIAAQSLAAPAKAGNGFAVGAGLAGFGIGAILGSALAPREVSAGGVCRSAAAAYLLRTCPLRTAAIDSGLV
jgi:hypothetical protein